MSTDSRKQPQLTEPAVTLLSRMRSGSMWVTNAHTEARDRPVAAGSPGEVPAGQWPKISLLKAEVMVSKLAPFL